MATVATMVRVTLKDEAGRPVGYTFWFHPERLAIVPDDGPTAELSYPQAYAVALKQK